MLAVKSPMACDHPSLWTAFKVNVQGKRMYCRQCPACGHRTAWIKPSAKELAEAVPLDEELEHDGWRVQREDRQREIDEKRAADKSEFDAWYAAYRQTPEWEKRRRLVMERAGEICEGCGVRSATQVHHITYKHVGEEFLWELRAVCRKCHERIHQKGFDNAD